MNQHLARIGRVSFGLLSLSAVITEIVVLNSEGVFNAANFFSFFTIISNIFAVAVLLYFGLTDNSSRTVSAIRGAATLYMLMTGVIFAILLAGLENVRLTATPWDNFVLHYLMPLVMLGDWLLFPPMKKLPAKTVLFWLILPLVYVLYTLIRGPLVQWYPYPFLNPAFSSYTQITLTSLVIAIGVAGAGIGLNKYIDLRLRR